MNARGRVSWHGLSSLRGFLDNLFGGHFRELGMGSESAVGRGQWPSYRLVALSSLRGEEVLKS